MDGWMDDADTALLVATFQVYAIWTVYRDALYT